MNTHTKGILVYLLIAFGFAWANWESRLSALASESNTSQFYGLILAAPSAFAPALATFIVRKWVTREGFGDAGLRIDLSKWRYYLVAWLLPLFIVGCIVVLSPICWTGQSLISRLYAVFSIWLQMGISASLLRYPWSFCSCPGLFPPFLNRACLVWRGVRLARLSAIAAVPWSSARERLSARDSFWAVLALPS